MIGVLAIGAGAAVAAAACACLVLAVALNANKQLTTVVACCGLLLFTVFASLVLSTTLDKPWLLVTAALATSCATLTTATTVCMRATQVRVATRTYMCQLVIQRTKMADEWTVSTTLPHS